MPGKEFEEIAHSGGIITIAIVGDANGNRAIQFGWRNNRPGPARLIGVYAVSPGIVVGHYSFMSGSTEDQTVPGSIPIIIGCDSEGLFGHSCPECAGYWRGGPFSSVCPYCGLKAQSYDFLSPAQLRYIRHYCGVWRMAEQEKIGFQVQINLDTVADATLRGEPKPDFYASEERQQGNRVCSACGELNDIIGRFAYCSVCGTRNDFEIFAKESIPTIRSRLVDGHPPEASLRDAVSAFDTLLKQYAKQLTARIPLTPRRRQAVGNGTFASITEMAASYLAWFDIDLRAGITEHDWSSARQLILRRHVYEHLGGVVDEDYILRSGDQTVRPSQHISESPQSVHEFLATLVSIAKRVHDGFHSIFPPQQRVISAHAEQLRKQRSK